MNSLFLIVDNFDSQKNELRITNYCQACWHVLVVSTLGNLRQESQVYSQLCSEVRSSLCYVRPSIKKTRREKKINYQPKIQPQFDSLHAAFRSIPVLCVCIQIKGFACTWHSLPLNILLCRSIIFLMLLSFVYQHSKLFRFWLWQPLQPTFCPALKYLPGSCWVLFCFSARESSPGLCAQQESPYHWSRLNMSMPISGHSLGVSKWYGNQGRLALQYFNWH